MRRAKQFLSSRGGNVAMTFAIVSVPLFGLAGAAIDYGRATSVQSSMQVALDTTALQLVQGAAGKSDAQLTTASRKVFDDALKNADVGNLTVSSRYDTAKKSLVVTASGTMETSLTKVLGFNALSVNARSEAALRPKDLAVCVLITEPTANHTLLVKNNAKIDFTNCMVQVNTSNWDAVEARDTSYIHSTNGQNCFVGDIHYGDVQPPKSASCTFFNDPFANYTLPAAASTCTYPKAANRSGALNPGTYCGGLSINADATLRPGLYIVKDGALKVTGAATKVTATGVTFLLTGTGAVLDLQGGSLNVTPASAADAGAYAGFAFHARSVPSGKSPPVSTISATTLSMSGILYLPGQTLGITNKAVLTVNPGSIVADYILPDDATLTLTGKLDTATSAEIAMQKAGGSTQPVIEN